LLRSTFPDEDVITGRTKEKLELNRENDSGAN
jgi:hypothetical protein